MDQELIANCKTELVQSKADIAIAARLSKYYNLDNMLAKEIDKIVNCDWWSSAELLTDVCKVGKHGYGEREAVCFLLLTEINLDKDSASSDVHISCFSPKPWYDLSIAVTWADFRIGQAYEHVKRAKNLIWPVDEMNEELQLELRNKGWTCKHYLKEEETMIFIK